MVSHPNAAFLHELIQAHGEQLRRYLAKRLRAEEDASDIAQEVFLRLLRLNRTDLIRQPLAYLYFVAAQVLAERRVQESKNPMIYDSELVDQHSKSIKANDFEDRENQQREIERLFAKLSDLQKKVILLRKRDGYSVAEIAGKLRLTVHQVRHHIVEANAILQWALRNKKR